MKITHRTELVHLKCRAKPKELDQVIIRVLLLEDHLWPRLALKTLTCHSNILQLHKYIRLKAPPHQYLLLPIPTLLMKPHSYLIQWFQATIEMGQLHLAGIINHRENPISTFSKFKTSKGLFKDLNCCSQIENQLWVICPTKTENFIFKIKYEQF